MIERYAPQDIADIFSEESKFKRFLKIEVLASEALAKLRIIPQSAYREIRQKAKISVDKIKKIEGKTHHDVVAFILNLSESLGKSSQYIHFGLTSSDLLDTTLAWQIKDCLEVILKDLEALTREVKKKALKYKDTICVGRTHGVHAEVYSFGLKFAFFYDELVRVRRLLRDSKDIVCCGKISGAVGAFAHLPPEVEEFVCKKIGVTAAKISSQVVSRDRLAYLLSILALLGSVIERFATEIRHLQKTETKEAEEPFYSGQKGSSAMPHKRNPIICERMSGLARLLRANMLAGFENINLWHERDISHSSAERVIIPDSISLVVYILRKFKEVIKNLSVYPENMLKNLEISQGLIYSQAVLLKLMIKGLKRERAYDLVQKISFEVIKNSTNLKEELLKSKEARKYLSSEEVEKIFLPHNYLKNINTIYKRLNLLR
ncbi:MAG: adenylosuccinate lyase [Candidatus Omnitrophota bacterium]|nr:MAG: adenylosuccinate lyase [Candidatus Omnitrophota bacterium]RKY35275.1 MAG: adenylosuccinate lyase [Candidatus Omnitrophota bacterium]RKY42554.1 MAG: adenylosuccinate lyase [Candidatus Omnitrophota bacterium]